MKQYTTPEQTAKLRELGFEKPKSISSIKVTGNIISTAEDLIGEPSSVMGGKITANYSIGELIEMLPQYLEYKGSVADIPIDYYALTIRQNVVMYCDPYMDWVEIQCNDHKELIDNLYDMILELKEEGTI